MGRGRVLVFVSIAVAAPVVAIGILVRLGEFATRSDEEAAALTRICGETDPTLRAHRHTLHRSREEVLRLAEKFLRREGFGDVRQESDAGIQGRRPYLRGPRGREERWFVSTVPVAGSGFSFHLSLEIWNGSVRVVRLEHHGTKEFRLLEFLDPATAEQFTIEHAKICQRAPELPHI